MVCKEFKFPSPACCGVVHLSKLLLQLLRLRLGQLQLLVQNVDAALLQQPVRALGVLLPLRDSLQHWHQVLTNQLKLGELDALGPAGSGKVVQLVPDERGGLVGRAQAVVSSTLLQTPSGVVPVSTRLRVC